MMEPKIENRDDARVLGIMARINPMEADYQELWGSRFDARQNEIASLAAEEGYYGVYYGTDEPGMADFVAGMRVDQVDEVPEGLIVREIPGGEYAVFECTMDTLSQTWGEIYSRWLPQAAYAEDETRPSLEYYPPDMMSPDMPVTISVPVKAK